MSHHCAHVLALFDAAAYESRTFLDDDGNPTLSITIDKNDKVSGISKFSVDSATGNILYVDSHKMIDQDTP